MSTRSDAPTSQLIAVGHNLRPRRSASRRTDERHQDQRLCHGGRSLHSETHADLAGSGVILRRDSHESDVRADSHKYLVAMAAWTKLNFRHGQCKNKAY